MDDNKLDVTKETIAPDWVNYDTVFCGYRLGYLVAIARLFEAHGESVTEIVDAIRFGYDEATSQMLKSMQSIIQQWPIGSEPPRGTT